VIDARVRITHLDGHQHLHVLPGIRDIVATLADRYGIAFVRRPAECVRAYMFRDPRRWPRLAELGVLRAVMRLSNAADRHDACDAFTGFYFGGRLDRNNLMTLLAALPQHGTCELMCHPGEHDFASTHAHWQYRWGDERDALCAPDVRALVRERGIELISFVDLQPRHLPRPDNAQGIHHYGRA
jgi:predicted glycoside hydrolase/deacetylase ChbG (UPF0249 family)